MVIHIPYSQSLGPIDGGPTPTITPTSTPTVTPDSEWKPNTYYSAGTVVTYQGVQYECIQSHTSLVGWEPPNVPALWLAL